MLFSVVLETREVDAILEKMKADQSVKKAERMRDTIINGTAFDFFRWFFSNLVIIIEVVVLLIFLCHFLGCENLEPGLKILKVLQFPLMHVSFFIFQS